MTIALIARLPATAITPRPTSLSRQNGRGAAATKARATPRLSAEKAPSALHSSRMKPTMLIPPRDEITPSITAPTVSASTGVFAATLSRTKVRAPPSPRKRLRTTTARTRSWKIESIAK